MQSSCWASLVSFFFVVFSAGEWKMPHCEYCLIIRMFLKLFFSISMQASKPDREMSYPRNSRAINFLYGMLHCGHLCGIL